MSALIKTIVISAAVIAAAFGIRAYIDSNRDEGRRGTLFGYAQATRSDETKVKAWCASAKGRAANEPGNETLSYALQECRYFGYLD